MTQPIFLQSPGNAILSGHSTAGMFLVVGQISVVVVSEYLLCVSEIPVPTTYHIAVLLCVFQVAALKRINLSLKVR